ncbi:antigenic WD protein [Trypanosoma grayi]|uniref:antigenic WD protein n=1 Tax=Trypanosoma grayi TaxID=71804 RepID=UPI0004F42739|nr:antigenic WD protein [Trypanosoma grayi]KEG06785.1 antigenic WD protein [Trypanosoma grayi]
MSKEKLKFTIAGKTVVYEGRRENQTKDLFDILVKMKVDQSVAVQAFRGNIDGAASWTDESICQQFSDAQRAYAEKKKRKEADATAEQPASPKKQVEKPQNITLSFQGKQFSYEGLPSGKQQAVVELLLRHDTTREVGVEAFRKNLPNSTATDDEIWAIVVAAKEAKAARKAAKKKDTAAGEVQSPKTQSPQQKDESKMPKSSTGAVGGVDAIDEITGMSVAERDSLSNFIKQVLEQPQIDLTARLRDDPSAFASGTSAARSPGISGPGGAYGDDDTSLGTTRTIRGKVAIYCQEGNCTTNKVLYITPATTFEEFSGMVEKKYGRKMAMSFYEGEDVIDMDDDDVFCMFLEMSQNISQEGKRMKLICAPLESRKRAMDDKITDAKDGNDYRAKAFSNGKLEVREERTFTAHTSAVYCCSFSPKGDRFCTASRDRSVRLWNTATGSCSVMKGGHNGFVLSCDFSPRGNRIVSSSDDRTIKIWNTTTCSKVSTLKGHDDKVYCVQYNTTGDYIVSGSCDHTVRVWNADTGSKMVTLRSHTLAVFSCGFSNTDAGKYVVSGGDDRMIKVWDWMKDEEFRSLSGHTDTVWSCAFSHDDRRIVTASMNHELKVWDWKSSNCILSWKGHQVPIHQAIFSADDKYIFSCARDWTVMVWGAETGEHYETIPGHHSTVYHMDVTGNKLLTSSLDDTLKLWTITAKD